MPLFLKHKFETTFDLTPSQFKDKLDSQVEKSRIIGFFRVKNKKAFYGEVNGDHFKIWRITRKRKGSMPNLEGCFKSYLGGVRVSIKMEPDYEVFTFVITWTIGTLGLAIVSLIYSDIFQSIAIYSLLLFIFGIFLVYQYFWTEVPKSKEKFLDIFKDNS